MAKEKHSPRFETVRRWYQDKKLWTAQMVENAVGHWITEAEKAEILKEEK